jgi:hypothetical protein
MLLLWVAMPCGLTQTRMCGSSYNIFKVAIYFSFVKTNDILIKSWRGKNCKQTLAEAEIEIIS